MKADPQLQRRLLDLAGIDTRLTQIAHRTTHMPQSETISALEERMAHLDSRIARASAEAEDVAHEVSKAESDVAQVRTRAERNRARLDAGAGSAKDVQALQHELESLARRQAELEEVELDAMERLEASQTSLAALQEERTPLEGELAAAEKERAAGMAELVEERAELEGRRQDVAGEIDRPLLDLYEKIRTQSGVGAAELRARRCGGCHMELMAGDLQRVRAAAADDVVRCEECRRIMVRTEESGL